MIVEAEWEHGRVSDASPPDSLTLEQAYRAASYLTDHYIGLETCPDEGLVLFPQYLRSDPARWDDWIHAVRKSLHPPGKDDPLTDNLDRTEGSDLGTN